MGGGGGGGGVKSNSALTFASASVACPSLVSEQPIHLPDLKLKPNKLQKRRYFVSLYSYILIQ